MTEPTREPSAERSAGKYQTTDLLQRLRNERLAKQASLSPPGIERKQQERHSAQLEEASINLYANTSTERKEGTKGVGGTPVVRAQSTSPTFVSHGSPSNNGWSIGNFKAQRSSLNKEEHPGNVPKLLCISPWQ